MQYRRLRTWSGFGAALGTNRHDTLDGSKSGGWPAGWKKVRFRHWCQPSLLAPSRHPVFPAPTPNLDSPTPIAHPSTQLSRERSGGETHPGAEGATAPETLRQTDRDEL